MPAMTDTSPEIAELVRSRLMALSGERRFLMGIQMCDAARRMVLASFPPDLTDAARKRLLYERYHGEPLPMWAELSACEPQ
jgi:hypothetical protein